MKKSITPRKQEHLIGELIGYVRVRAMALDVKGKLEKERFRLQNVAKTRPLGQLECANPRGSPGGGLSGLKLTDT